MALAPGTSGQVLQTQGAAANPVWAAAGGSGTVTSVIAGTGLTGGTITTTGTIGLGTELTGVNGLSHDRYRETYWCRCLYGSCRKFNG